MSKIHEFDSQIYPRKLWVVINPSMDVLNNEFEDITQLDDSESAVVHHAHNKNKNLGGALIIFKSKKELTPSNITHEAIHAALVILEYIEFRLDYQNQEPLAYLAGWITDCIYKVKNNK